MKNQSKAELLTQTFISILLNSILGIVFFIFTANENRHGIPNTHIISLGSSDCIYLRSCGLYFSLYCFIMIIIRM